MMRLLVLLLSLATMTGAQSLPDRYSVTNVAEDDVLNIRSGPGPSFGVIGAFGPYTLNVEVSEIRDGWGMVPAGEVNGWVSMQFLMPYPLTTAEVPRPLVCSGTEPFWTLGLYPRGAEFSELSLGERRDLTVVQERTASNGYFVHLQEGPTLSRRLTVSAGHCSDGMSDRTFNMSAILFNDAPDGNHVLTGCCTFQSN